MEERKKCLILIEPKGILVYKKYVGQSVEGFTVSFDWLGTGLPGSQPFEIINPLDSQTIDSGNTVPEPATLLLFALGTIFLRKKS